MVATRQLRGYPSWSSRNSLLNCPSPLTIFLRELKVESFQDCIDEAGRWIDAHGHPLATNKSTKHTKEVRPNSLKRGEGSVRHKDNRKSFTADCWKCGKSGHKQATRRVMNKQTTAGMTDSKKRCEQGKCNQKHKYLILGDGVVNGKTVTAMLDGGSTMCVVAEKLVSTDQNTRKELKLTLVNGSVVVMPEAKVKICTPWYSGTVFAAVCPTPVYDLVVGGVQNLNSFNNEQENPCSESEARDGTGDDNASKENDEMSTAVTRGQEQRGETAVKPLRVNDVRDIVSTARFVEAQGKDRTLNSIRNHVSERKVFQGKGRVSKFIMKRKRLYRITESNGLTEQLIVPRAFRKQVFKLGHEGTVL